MIFLEVFDSGGAIHILHGQRVDKNKFKPKVSSYYTVEYGAGFTNTHLKRISANNY